MNVIPFVLFMILIYAAGLVSLVLFSSFSQGLLFFHGLICIIGLWCFRKKRRWLAGLAAALTVSTLLLYRVPDTLRIIMINQELLLLGLCFYMEKKAVNIISYCQLRSIRLSQIPMLLAESVLLILIAAFINACSMLFFKNEVADTLAVAAQYFPAAVLILCVAPAATEELLFRGGILRSFQKPWMGVLWSSVLFALWHVNLNQMSYAFAAGLLLAVMAVWTNNLICPMITHFLFNIYNLLSVYASPRSMTGRLLLLWENFMYRLFPELTTQEGTFIWKNFLQGLTISIVAIILYLTILYMNRPQIKESEKRDNE